MRREAHLLRWQGSYSGQDTIVYGRSLLVPRPQAKADSIHGISKGDCVEGEK